MIVYFADRKELEILGHAATNIQKGFVIVEDLKTEDIETGIASFDCLIAFEDENRLKLEEMTDAGNYILRSNGDENEFYTIIDTEIDTKNKTIRIYAEDAGLDLINELVGAFEADKSYTAEWYINKYIVDTGFEIRINEIPSSATRKLKFEGEATVTERLASIAAQFGGYEIAYTFDIDGLYITNKYINIYKERGKDNGEQLRLNREIDRIITSKSVANLATGFVCEGGVPEKAENPITLKGYKYDDGNFFVNSDGILLSREAVNNWRRYVWNKDQSKKEGNAGHILKPYSYDTTSQATLCSHAIAELKKVCDMEINYEIDIKRLPAGVKIGDRINIVDDAGEQYISTRVLRLQYSAVDQTHTATLGEHLIKTSGIAQKVKDLAEQFAKNAASAVRALAVANSATTTAESAKVQAEAAAAEVQNAQTKAEEAKTAATEAKESALTAKTEAEEAKAAVETVEKSVEELEAVVTVTQQAIETAKTAAQTAETKANEAKNAAQNAEEKAEEAKQAADKAQENTGGAISNSAAAIVAADIAKEKAEDAKATAAAAKADAEKAEADVASLGERLETVSKTMQADYARKTELTETTAHLQSQISKNAAELNSTFSLLMTVDETANDAQEKAAEAQAKAAEAQTKADAASADAEAAQIAADNAKAAAVSAQTEADTARAAADTAQRVAEQAEAELEAALIDFATISAKAEATAEEIEAAQAAVNEAQAAADNAKTNAEAAIETAAEAQIVANSAAVTAFNAQIAADKASADAYIAQQLANSLNTDAETAKNKAEQASSLAEQAKTAANTAQETATAAQATADTAAANAEEAKTTAANALAEAETAQATADKAALKVAQAAADLALAEERLAEVLADAEATEAEIAAAQSAVTSAQAFADSANTEAATAQAEANTAKANADAAQAAATAAEVAAQNAQTAAAEAKAAADEAQAAADGLAVRVTKAETKITQNAREFSVRVSEVEDATTANGKHISAAEALIEILSRQINFLVQDAHGASLMQQASDGATWYFNTEGIDGQLAAASESIKGLEDKTTETNLAAEKAQRDLAAYEERFTVGVFEDEPCVIFHELDSDRVQILTNTRRIFARQTESGYTDLKITDYETVRSPKFEADESFAVGGWVWQQRNNGRNLGLVWKGAVDNGSTDRHTMG